MVSDLPEWLVEYLEENTGFKRPGYFGYPYYTTTKQSDAVVEFYEFISKPTNAAKLSCVKTLIEAAQQTRQDIDTILKVRTEITIAMAEGHINDLDDALKPFKKEGSDG